MGLYATTLWRTATVVGKRSYVNDLGNFDTSSVNGADCGLTTVARTFDISLHFAEAEVISHLGAILSCHLSCVGSVLLRATETHLACR